MTGEAAHDGGWGETLVVTLACGALIAVATVPAFRAYFFGEAFLYLGQYWGARESYWRALFSPSDIIFFKPVCFSASLPWYFWLPLDPWAYHVRNFAFTLVDLALLHRIARRLIASRPARLLAMTAFAASKVHLTTIGYIMIFDSIVMLLCLLAAVLFALRWCDSHAASDRRLALLWCALAAFTKDYGVCTVAVVAATVAVDAWASRARPGETWHAWVLPLAVIMVAKAALRWAVVGSLPWDNPWYAPRFSLLEVGRKLLLFGSALTNLSVARHDRTGASGIGTIVARGFAAVTGHAPPSVGAIDGAEMIDALAAVAVVALMVVTWWKVRPRSPALAIPIVWIAAFLAPTFLIGNFQIYYAYEPLAGAVLLLGIVLASAERGLRVAWTIALAAIAVAGIASNRAGLYDWQFAAKMAGTLQEPLLARYATTPFDGVTFVTTDPAFWRWTLTADDKAPMIPALMDRPSLRVSVGPAGDARPASDRHLVLDADAAFARLGGPHPSP